MGLALDEPDDDDETIEEDGVTFLIDRRVRDMVAISGDVRIAYFPDADQFSGGLGQKAGGCC